MLITVFDTESNGLLHEATRLHCAVTKSNQSVARKYGPTNIGVFIDALMASDIIVAHNAICHDLPLLENLHGYKHEGRVLDTLVLSRLLQPERVGRHSLEAWGERFGIPKPEHEDWSTFTPEMMYRCTQDVEINYRLLYHLLDEARLTEEDLCQIPMH